MEINVQVTYGRAVCSRLKRRRMPGEKPRGSVEPKKNWILYLDEKGNIGCLEDDHFGVDAMIKSRPGWKHLGYYYGGFYAAKKYAKEVFI